MIIKATVFYKCYGNESSREIILDSKELEEVLKVHAKSELDDNAIIEDVVGLEVVCS